MQPPLLMPNITDGIQLLCTIWSSIWINALRI
jgi:hypothetical protein